MPFGISSWAIQRPSGEKTEYEYGAMKTMTNVRLVTWTGDLPDGDYDSRPLLEALRERALTADIRAWNDGSVDWSDATVTVIRSTWDYHRDHEGFLRWIDRAAAVTALHNPRGLVRWNTDKRYLLDLERRGIGIVPTLSIETAALIGADSVEHAVRDRGWRDVVLKPAVSLDGHGVHRATLGGESLDAAIDALADAGPIIVQPFMRGIESDGELSLAFIDGRFSHAVRKRAAAGDFRVQERLGGTIEAHAAPLGSVAFAKAVLATLDMVPLYARVDLIALGTRGAQSSHVRATNVSPAGVHETFLLTELELVEPSLFLATHEGAAVTFADAIAEKVARTRIR